MKVKETLRHEHVTATALTCFLMLLFSRLISSFSMLKGSACKKTSGYLLTRILVEKLRLLIVHHKLKKKKRIPQILKNIIHTFSPLFTASS